MLLFTVDCSIFWGAERTVQVCSAPQTVSQTADVLEDLSQAIPSQPEGTWRHCGEEENVRTVDVQQL